MMTRNTEKRVEVACPIYDDAIKRRLIHDLKVMLADNVKARIMTSDGADVPLIQKRQLLRRLGGQTLGL